MHSYPEHHRNEYRQDPPSPKDLETAAAAAAAQVIPQAIPHTHTRIHPALGGVTPIIGIWAVPLEKGRGYQNNSEPIR